MNTNVSPDSIFFFFFFCLVSFFFLIFFFFVLIGFFFLIVFCFVFSDFFFLYVFFFFFFFVGFFSFLSFVLFFFFQAHSANFHSNTFKKNDSTIEIPNVLEDYFLGEIKYRLHNLNSRPLCTSVVVFFFPLYPQLLLSLSETSSWQLSIVTSLTRSPVLVNVTDGCSI